MNGKTGPVGPAQTPAKGVYPESLAAPADETSDPTPLGFQPMPALTDDQYAALRADIEARGIVVRVVVDQHGRLLDGHHRRRIAAELGIDCPVEVRKVADDQEAADLAVALNCARRHLTREQIREVIRAELARRPQDSDRAIARRVGCDHKTVGAVRRGRSGEVPHPGVTSVLLADVEADAWARVEQETRRAWAEFARAIAGCDRRMGPAKTDRGFVEFVWSMTGGDAAEADRAAGILSRLRVASSAGDPRSALLLRAAKDDAVTQIDGSVA